MTNPRRFPPFRRLAHAQILRLAGARRIVVIAPHPDDETLGCGGLIAHAVRNGAGVAVIALTDGDASHPGSQRWPPPALGRLRAGEMRRALARLGAGRALIKRLRWRDGKVAAGGRLLQLRGALLGLHAGVVVVTSDADHHPDHQAASRLARSAANSLGLPVVDYAVWSRANAGVQGGGRYRGAKRWAIVAHRSQVMNFIDDCADGFRLSPNDLSNLIGGSEIFRLRRRPAALLK